MCTGWLDDPEWEQKGFDSEKQYELYLDSGFADKDTFVQATAKGFVTSKVWEEMEEAYALGTTKKSETIEKIKKHWHCNDLLGYVLVCNNLSEDINWETAQIVKIFSDAGGIERLEKLDYGDEELVAKYEEALLNKDLKRGKITLSLRCDGDFNFDYQFNFGSTLLIARYETPLLSREHWSNVVLAFFNVFPDGFIYRDEYDSFNPSGVLILSRDHEGFIMRGSSYMDVTDSSYSSTIDTTESSFATTISYSDQIYINRKTGKLFIRHNSTLFSKGEIVESNNESEGMCVKVEPSEIRTFISTYAKPKILAAAVANFRERKASDKAKAKQEKFDAAPTIL